jgi:hypothetical protein
MPLTLATTQALARLYHESWEMGLQARIIRDRLCTTRYAALLISPPAIGLTYATSRSAWNSSARERCTLILRLSFDIGH